MTLRELLDALNGIAANPEMLDAVVVLGARGEAFYASVAGAVNEDSQLFAELVREMGATHAVIVTAWDEV